MGSEILKGLPEESSYSLIEPFFCSQGSINGPGIETNRNLFERRKDILEYDRETVDIHTVPNLEEERFFYASYREEAGLLREVSEEEILQILEKTGKSDPQQQLNCGACGYDSCREKAVAVALGMAEPEMCIPSM